jgi:uncharacterized membrane protein YqjE
LNEVPAPAEAPGKPSIRALFHRLGDEFVLLVRSELRLAGGEVRDNLAQAAGSLVVLSVGLMLVSVAMLCLLGAAVVFLAQFTSLLAAALIVAAIATILGGIAITIGINRLKDTSLAPKRAGAGLRELADKVEGDGDGIGTH